MLPRRYRLSIALLTVGLLTEEIASRPPVALDRIAAMRMLAAIAPPPASCRIFYVTGRQTVLHNDLPQAATALRPNVDAMLISAMRGVPTVNGYSTFNPPDWDFADISSARYPFAIARYAAVHDLNRGLCRLDLGTGQWQVLLDLRLPSLTLNQTVPLGTGSPLSANVFLSGWDVQEATGRWTNNTDAVLLLNLPRSVLGRSLQVSLTMSALLPPDHTQGENIRIMSDGQSIASLRVGAQTETFGFTVPERPDMSSPDLRLDLLQSQLRRPDWVGAGGDARLLGVFVSALRVDAAASDQDGSQK